jgi:hypothetical protein
MIHAGILPHKTTGLFNLVQKGGNNFLKICDISCRLFMGIGFSKMLL